MTILVTAVLLASLASAESLPPLRSRDAFERVSPEEVGYSTERLKALESFLERSGSDSLLLLHDGKVFFESGDIRKRLLVHSMRKALLNSLFGIYEHRGKIDLDQTLGALRIDDIPEPLTDDEKTATLRDVLKSRSGVYHEADRGIRGDEAGTAEARKRGAR